MRVWLTLIAILTVGVFTLQSLAHCGAHRSKEHAKTQAKADDGMSCASSCTKAATAKTVSDKSCASSCTKAATVKTVSDKSCASSCTKAATVKTVSDKSCASSCTKTGDAKMASASCCAAGSKAACASGKGDLCVAACPTALVAAAPTMDFVVETKTDKKYVSAKTNCACTAEKIAEMTGGKLVYTVAGHKYDTKGEALAAYSEKLDAYLGKMTKVEYVIGNEKTCCGKTAEQMAKKNGSKIEYRVASVSFPNAKLAEHAAEQAKQAIGHVSMKYVVDGKEYTCSQSAGSHCSGSKKMAYKVGENTTECEMTAKVALLRERINSAAQVVAKAAQEGQASANAG
jgi:hypothetical protein